MKYVMILCCLIFMTGALPVCNIRTLTYITIIFVFFPIYIPFMGRDAITTGTICIFLLYLRYLSDSFRDRAFIKEKYDYWIYLLIIFGATSIIFPYWTGVLEKSQLGPAVRHFFGFFGAMLLFLIIKNYREDNSQSSSESYTDHIERLLSLFLILVSLHILISIGVKFFPPLGSAFKPFLSRKTDVLEIHGMDKLERIVSFVFSYEDYGEILAALSPLVLYKIFKFRTPTWLLCLLLLGLATLYTATRSGILLFVFGLTVSLLYHSRKQLGKALVLTYILSTLLFVLIYFHPSIFADVSSRFDDALQAYRSTGDLLETANRKGVFVPAWDDTISNLSFFGNGVTEFHYHNLFLTTLHQKGIIGATFFFIVFLYTAVRLIKSFRNDTSVNKVLIFSCLLSMVLFLINETKYEFTRHDSYQQICWGLFGIYYLVSMAPFQKKE